jgi:glycerate 2-kinase
LVGPGTVALTTAALHDLRERAGRILRAAIDAVDPATLLSAAYSQSPLSRRPRSRAGRDVRVIAAGKAAWPMARAFAALEPDAIAAGMLVGPADASSHPRGFERFDGGHPNPNAASVAAGQRALELAQSSREPETLVVLLSGGASALLVAPVAGVTLEDKIVTGRALMRAGVVIGDLNCVRKHLSRIKGGQLAAAAGRTVTFAISDVHGPIPDDPSVIGSGPTIADPTTFAQALEIIAGVDGIPVSVRRCLEAGARGEVPETVKPGDPRLAADEYRIVGNRETALHGAVAAAAALGYRVHTIARPVEGEARDAARAFVDEAQRVLARSSGPMCILAAGETTVTVTGGGLGGRNQELAVAAAPALASLARPAVLGSVGTDGIDGPTDAAGAIVDSTTLERARRAGLDWESTLARHDAYHFLQPLGDLVVWGPTGTNVGDVQVLLAG